MASIYSVSQVNAYIKNMFPRILPEPHFNQGGGIQLQVPYVPGIFILH